MSDDTEPDPDVAWLLARERGEAVTPPPGRAEGYARLEAMIAELPPSGWEERVLRRVDVEERRRRGLRALLYAAPVLAAAAVLLVLVLRSDRPAGTPEIDVSVRRGGEVHRATTAGLGDVLVIAPTLPAPAELRVYRDQRLVARCPGDRGCTGLHLELELAAPGNYRAIGLHGAAAPPPSGELEADLRAARAGGVRLVAAVPVEVR